MKRNLLDMRQVDVKQAGMVSLIVTVILMFVISITVLGFAQIIRRSQREALDNQLSTQAFYAAESGINDARTVLAKNPTASLSTCAKPAAPNPFAALNYTVNAASNVSYSCLLVDPAPTTLHYTLDPTSQSTIIPIKTGSFDTIKLHWSNSQDSSDPTGKCSASTGLPPVADWTCPPALLRVDLVPTSNLTRTALLQNQFTAFLLPATSGVSTVAYSGGGGNVYGGTASQGIRPAVICSADGCDVRITMGSPVAGDYYMRVSAVYRQANLTVQALTGVTPQPLSDAEAAVDATGKAQDVLRRLRVYVPLSGNAVHADYGLQTTNEICKLFSSGKDLTGAPLSNTIPCSAP